jgi:hypothetical protein
MRFLAVIFLLLPIENLDEGGVEAIVCKEGKVS